MKERQVDPLCPRLVAMGMETGQEDQVFFLQFDPPCFCSRNECVKVTSDSAGPSGAFRQTPGGILFTGRTPALTLRLINPSGSGSVATRT